MLLSYHTLGVLEAGCDEAGRGCLAGPVFAASVILPPDYKNAILNDSKKVGVKLRSELREEIEKVAIAFAVRFVDNHEIDKINILNASILAMHQAIDGLKKKPENLLIDGNRFKKFKNIPYHCIIKGDGKYLSIAAASILAKTYRDDYMELLSAKFPEYEWEKNKGWPNLQHKLAIQNHGLSTYHRSTFKHSIGR
jgi:ribonuclease HII